MDELDIPQLVDNYPQMLFWEFDELAPIFVGMIAGLLFDRMTTGIALGLMLAWAYIRFKREVLPGSLLHMCYWWGLFPLNEHFSNGLNREAVQ